MAYTVKGDVVTLEMSRDDYDGLLLALGIASGCARRDQGEPTFWRWIALTNRINEGNPNFTSYEIPDGLVRNPLL